MNEFCQIQCQSIQALAIPHKNFTTVLPTLPTPPPSIPHPPSPSSLLFLCSSHFFHPIPIIDNWHYFNIPIRRSTFYAAILLTRFMCLSKAIRYPAKTLRSPLYLLVQTFILRLSVRQV